MPDDASQLFGRSTPRIDGVAKVTGAARYASDEPVANPAFAYLVTSAIARGRIGGFNLDRAKALAGVLDILTHENVGGLGSGSTYAGRRPDHDDLGERPDLARRTDHRRGRRRHL